MRPGFVRSTGLIALGNVVGQAVGVVGIIALARLYGPRQFGEFSAVVAIAAIVGSVAAGRFEAAIPLPSDDGAAYGIARFCAACALVVGLASLIVVGITEIFDGPSVLSLVSEGFLAGAGLSLVQSMNQLAIRLKMFRLLSIRSALIPVVTIVFQFLLNISGFEANGLEFGYIMAYFLMAGVLVIQLDVVRVPSEPLRALLYSYRRFPLHLAPAGVLNVLGQQMAVFIVTWNFGASVAGWFGMTQRSLAVPLSLVGTAVSQVYLSHASQLAREEPERLPVLFDQVARRLLIAACLIAVALPLVSPLAYPVLLGSRWSEAGIYAAILAPALAAQMVAVPLSQTLIVLGWTRFQLLWDAGRCVALGEVGFLAWCGLTARAVIICVSAVLTVTYVLLFVLNRHAVRRPMVMQ